MKNPRWINEIPKPIPINEKIEITEEMKKEAEEFSIAVENGKIDEWFNKKIKFYIIRQNSTTKVEKK